jgi:hypothetical protein
MSESYFCRREMQAFMHALAMLLRSEPVQPPGDGVVNRHALALLSRAETPTRVEAMRAKIKDGGHARRYSALIPNSLMVGHHMWPTWLMGRPICPRAAGIRCRLGPSLRR